MREGIGDGILYIYPMTSYMCNLQKATCSDLAKRSQCHEFGFVTNLDFRFLKSGNRWILNLVEFRIVSDVISRESLDFENMFCLKSIFSDF